MLAFEFHGLKANAFARTDQGTQTNCCIAGSVVLEFGLWGSGFWAGSCFWVLGSCSGVWGVGFVVCGLGFWALGSDWQGSGVRGSGFCLAVWEHRGSGFWGSGVRAVG